jgi:putative FmdB family regulatory protein
MPIYEYKCPNGHTFEVFQRMSDPAVEVCESCGAGPVTKVLFPVAVHFKGSGFYSTDYGRGSKKVGAKDGDGSGATQKDSGGGADSGSSSKADSGSKSTSGDKKATAAE